MPLTAHDHDLKKYIFSLEYRSNQNLFTWADSENFDIKGQPCLIDTTQMAILFEEVQLERWQFKGCKKLRAK